MGKERRENRSSSSTVNVLSRTINNLCRKVHRVLTLSEELQVINLVEQKQSDRKNAAQFDISRSQVQRIRLDKENIKKVSEEKQLSDSFRHLKNKAKFPEIDKAVYNWLLTVRSPENRLTPLPISRAHIQCRAKREAGLRNVQDFKASDGWFRRWRNRFSIGDSVRLYGEAGDVNLAEMEPIMDDFREQLQDYRPENIFNMDETGLFYRALPSRTYISESDGDRSKVRGSKALKAKDRITLVLCVNATGSCKVPPLIIGTAKTPHCFRDSPCPLPYADQKKRLDGQSSF